MYTDNTIVQYGIYRYARLGQVGADILLQLYNVRQYPNPSFKEYIERNLAKLQQCVSGETNSTSHTVVACKKVPYATQKIAKFELKRIRETIQEHSKPIRTYECDICSAWHLTSIPYDAWKLGLRKAPDLRKWTIDTNSTSSTH
jgi:hypothetical protein